MYGILMLYATYISSIHKIYCQYFCKLLPEEVGHGWLSLILITGSSLISLGYCTIKASLAFAVTGPGFEILIWKVGPLSVKAKRVLRCGNQLVMSPGILIRSTMSDLLCTASIFLPNLVVWTSLCSFFLPINVIAETLPPTHGTHI